MAPILMKLMFFLVMQLMFSSTIYCKNDYDDAGNDVSAGTTTSVDTDADATQDYNQVAVGKDNPMGITRIEIADNTPRAVSGVVTPDTSCDQAIINAPFIDTSSGAPVTHENVIAMVPYAVWNQEGVNNCQATMLVYCLPSTLGDCKEPDTVSSVPVNIVGYTAQDASPVEYVLDPSPFSVVADPGADVIAIYPAIRFG